MLCSVRRLLMKNGEKQAGKMNRKAGRDILDGLRRMEEKKVTGGH